MHFNSGKHKWTGRMQGGSPVEAGSTEWVRYCDSCGMEDTCEDPLPGCPSTFGVMQPTGDRWHEGLGGFTNAPIDRVAGSPWIGREFARRMYGGKGPYFPGYKHMFVDEELQRVAEKYGVFWQRRDLTQRHNHWGRGATDKAVIEAKIPAHLVQWNTPEHWKESKALFESRKGAGFPGAEPIA